MAKKFKYCLFAFTVIFLLLTFVKPVLATEVKYPPIGGYSLPANPQLPDFIEYFFYLAVVSAGILGVLSIVIAGITMLATAGSPGAQGAARERIFNSILGIILLLFSVVLLRTVNPNLVSLRVQSQKPTPGDYFLFLRSGLPGGAFGAQAGDTIDEEPAPQSAAGADIPEGASLLKDCDQPEVDELVWLYPDETYDDTDPGAKTEILTCGESISLEGAGSFKRAILEPSVIWFTETGGNGAAFMDTSFGVHDLPAAFQNAGSMAIINPKDDLSEPLRAVVVNDASGFSGRCGALPINQDFQRISLEDPANITITDLVSNPDLCPTLPPPSPPPVVCTTPSPSASASPSTNPCATPSPSQCFDDCIAAGSPTDVCAQQCSPNTSPSSSVEPSPSGCPAPPTCDPTAGCCTGDVPPCGGCTDINANNYDPNATYDDGSCTYDPPASCNPVPVCTNANACCPPDPNACGFSIDVCFNLILGPQLPPIISGGPTTSKTPSPIPSGIPLCSPTPSVSGVGTLTITCGFWSPLTPGATLPPQPSGIPFCSPNPGGSPPPTLSPNPSSFILPPPTIGIFPPPSPSPSIIFLNPTGACVTDSDCGTNLFCDPNGNVGGYLCNDAGTSSSFCSQTFVESCGGSGCVDGICARDFSNPIAYAPNITLASYYQPRFATSTVTQATNIIGPIPAPSPVANEIATIQNFSQPNISLASLTSSTSHIRLAATLARPNPTITSAPRLACQDWPNNKCLSFKSQPRVVDTCPTPTPNETPSPEVSPTLSECINACVANGGGSPQECATQCNPNILGPSTSEPYPDLNECFNSCVSDGGDPRTCGGQCYSIDGNCFDTCTGAGASIESCVLECSPNTTPASSAEPCPSQSASPSSSPECDPAVETCPSPSPEESSPPAPGLCTTDADCQPSYCGSTSYLVTQTCSSSGTCENSITNCAQVAQNGVCQCFNGGGACQCIAPPGGIPYAPHASLASYYQAGVAAKPANIKLTADAGAGTTTDACEVKTVSVDIIPVADPKAAELHQQAGGEEFYNVIEDGGSTDKTTYDEDTIKEVDHRFVGPKFVQLNPDSIGYQFQYESLDKLIQDRGADQSEALQNEGDDTCSEKNYSYPCTRAVSVNGTFHTVVYSYNENTDEERCQAFDNNIDNYAASDVFKNGEEAYATFVWHTAP